MLKRFDMDNNEPDKRCAEEIPGHGMNRNRRQRIEKDFEKKDSKRRVICGIIGICISAVLTGVITGKRAEAVDEKMDRVQERLSKEVFRFHVQANSDSDEDQEVKLEVRDAVLDYMKEDMGQETSAEETKAWAKAHLDELSQRADQVLDEHGFPYRARASVTECYFPEKRYGDITFPQGNYEALRIELGNGKGHNWWCVLYPNLCFMDTTCAVVSDEGRDALKETLEEDEYEMITAADRFKIRWFFFGDREKQKDRES